MDKQLLDDAIGTAPPSTVDVEAIIGRQRRAARVRVVANPWVATATVVLAIVGGVWLVPDGVGAGPAPTSAALAPEPTCVGSGDVAAVSGPLYERLREALPGTGLGDQPEVDVKSRDPHSTGCFDALSVGSDLDGTGHLRLVVETRGAGLPPIDSCGGAPIDTWDCAVRTGQDGEVVVSAVHRAVGPDPDGPAVATRVAWVTRPGSQRLLTFYCGAADPVATPPLTADQLMTAALDPELTRYLG